MADTGCRSVYLITYSQADRAKVECKEEFAALVTEEFQGCEIVQWVCSEERHKDGGFHYHLAVKLDRVKRWRMVRDRLDKNYGVKVNFSDRHSNYYSAYKYVTKEGDYITSEGHPVYVGSPQTSKASSSKRKLSQENEEPCSSKSSRSRKVDIVSVQELIVAKKVRSDKELCREANRELKDGKRDLAAFILSKTERARTELIKTCWKMYDAEDELQREDKTRLQIFDEVRHEECSCNETDQWFNFAVELLELNQINPVEFTTAIFYNLEKGRQKKSNLILVGPSNCGKSFLFRPLAEIFKTFKSPASNSFAWVNAPSSELVFLNDFRWCEKIIPWHDFLNLLEGEAIHISSPKTHFSEDILWSKIQPIFCTSDSEIVKVTDQGQLNVTETEMMANRWTVVKMFVRLTKEKIKTVEPCKRCFFEFVDTFRNK